MRNGTVLTPAMGHARIIHPLVQELDVRHQCRIIWICVFDIQSPDSWDGRLAVLRRSHDADVVPGSAGGGWAAVDAGRLYHGCDPETDVLT